jgi:hypothetical protein
MPHASAFLLSLALVQSTPRAVESLSNGNFELMAPSGSPSDGGFWMGAEGRTVVSGLTRVLRLPSGGSTVVCQKVACAPDLVSTTTLGAKVKIGLGGCPLSRHSSHLQSQTARWTRCTGHFSPALSPTVVVQ